MDQDQDNPIVDTTDEESIESQMRELVEVQDSSSDYVVKDEDEVIQIPKAVLLNLLSQIEDLNSEIDDLEDQLTTIQDNLSSFDERSDRNAMRLDSMYSFFDSQITEMQDEYEQRISELEQQVSPTNVETETQQPKSEIEQLAQNHDKSNLQINTQRAITVYQNFNQWSESIPAGRRIKSGHLQTALSEEYEEVNWMKQVHRVMNRFDELTDDTYVLRETKRFGTAIIKQED